MYVLRSPKLNLFFFFPVSDNVMGLEKVNIHVPTAVKLGGNTIISCESDLVDMDLYQVKWYKGKREFFRFTSKEIPSIKIFPRTGIHVNVGRKDKSKTNNLALICMFY